ncbi:MAG: hypothetical protein LC754_05925 [Acidobacteria bacterium]|nr:hypothetical protein [Acidobacteriota bacterium]
MKRTSRRRWRQGISDERGGARFNFIIIVLLIAVGGYSLYQYAPIAYQAYRYKDYMQEIVNKAAFPPGQSASWVETQLRAGTGDSPLPPNTIVQAQNVNGHIEARVQWTRPVTLPGYVYQYRFDHTARSSGFINP